MLRFIFSIAIGSILASCHIKVQQASTTESLNKRLIENYYQIFNTHNWQKMAALYVETPELKDPVYGTKAVKMTQAEIVKKYTELQHLIPDVHDEIVTLYEAGDNVIVEFVSTGTMPDQTKFELPICTIFEIKDGKITKDLTYYDNFESEQQPLNGGLK